MKVMLQTICIALGVLCAFYGTAVRGVGSGNRFFLVWWMGTGFFVALAAAIRFDFFSKIPRALSVAALCVILCGLLYVCVCSALVISHFDDTTDEDLDVVIVLGAQVHPTGPSIILRHRLDTAYEYLCAHPGTRCIVSGGQGENEHAPEAYVMREYLVALGIDASRIITEERSENTIGNIRNCMELLDPAEESVGIITNDFHLFRGVAIAKKQGIQNARGIAAPSRVFFYPHNILRECVGILKDKLLGNL